MRNITHKRNSNWTTEETLLLIQMWGEFRLELLTNKRNLPIYEKISESMKIYNVNRTAIEVRSKVKNLTNEYRKEKIKSSKAGTAPSGWKFYSLVDKIIGGASVNGSSFLDENSSQANTETTETKTVVRPSTALVTARVSILKARVSAKASVLAEIRGLQEAALKTGSLIIEGKTKRILEIVGDKENVLMVSKDRITAGDGVKAHDMEGKSVISTATTAKIFEYLNEVGIKTHYIRQHDEKSLIVKKCNMIPIEWVSRRHATGSFLKRNPGVKEGYRFSPLKLETFYKDDENHDPQWSDEQLICAELVVGGMKLGRAEVEIMHKTTACIFEVLEKAWASLDCSLIDMKVEYGVTQNGELVLADVIDSDSWRLWPAGDKRLMVDKQVYRNLTTVTAEDLEKVKRNFQWVAEKVKEFLVKPKIQVVILMGSPSDKGFCQKIQDSCKKFGVPSFMRVTSAHKGPDETLNIIAQYEGSGQPTVFIAVAGRSNGLGPVTSGNSAFPVINCPPVTADWGREDIWSSLRLPSGLGCTTILSPEGAALAAAQILALTDHVIWSRLKAQQLNRWVDLKRADAQITA